MDSDKMPEPVAWVERSESGNTRMWSFDLSAWANRPVNPEPLYSAETVQALCAEVNEQARLNGMGAEREARLMAQVAELRAERDALAKDAARYRWLCEGGLYRVGFDSTGRVSLSMLDSAIDAAMSEEER